MQSTAIAVLELDGSSLVSCSLSELVPQPLKGSLYVIGGNLYRVSDMPLSFICPTADFDGQLLEVLRLLHAADPAAATMAAGIRNLMSDEAVSSGGLVIVSGAAKPVFGKSDRLVYVQLKLEK